MIRFINKFYLKLTRTSFARPTLCKLIKNSTPDSDLEGKAFYDILKGLTIKVVYQEIFEQAEILRNMK